MHKELKKLMEDWLLEEEEKEQLSTSRSDEEQKERGKDDMRNIILTRPVDFEDHAVLDGEIRNGQIVVMDLNDTREKDKQRLLDYVSGVSFAGRGSIHEISKDIYMILPEGDCLVGK